MLVDSEHLVEVVCGTRLETAAPTGHQPKVKRPADCFDREPQQRACQRPFPARWGLPNAQPGNLTGDYGVAGTAGAGVFSHARLNA